MRLSVLIWLLTVMSGCLAQDLLLFWQLYSIAVRGGSILHDISRGVGAASRAMEAIDSFILTHDEEAEQKEEVFNDPDTANTVGVPSSTNEAFTGCGALGFHIKDSTLPVTKLTNCCGEHATCYSSSCKVNKRDCDNKLKKCLMAVCNDKSLDKTKDKTIGKTCQAAGKLMYSGTMALSFQQYHDAQGPLKCKSEPTSKQNNSKKSGKKGR